jgi:hypothetical protein
MTSGSAAREQLELLDVDRDRKIGHVDVASVVVDEVVVGLGCVGQFVGGRDEVAGPALALESEHVGAEQTLDDLGPPRQPLEQLQRWERDVVEPSDPHVGALRPQHRRHELEVVVVQPHRGVLRCDVGEPDREPFVDRDVGVPVVDVEVRVLDGIVVERPQVVVREALVVPGHLVLRDRHRVHVDAVGVDHLGRPVGLARPADPSAVAERPDETAGARFPLTVIVERDRQPVGRNDQRPWGCHDGGLLVLSDETTVPVRGDERRRRDAHVACCA